MKILLVDDSKAERMLIHSYLSTKNYEIVQADCGESALALYVSTNPDLILLDVLLPGISGYEVAKQLRQKYEDWVPIIFLSGKHTPQDIMVGIEAGGDDYLCKPVNKQVLMAKMTAMERIAKMRARLLFVSKELEQANRHLSRLANTDGLTGVANRHLLTQYLNNEYNRCRRFNHPLAMLIIDIDDFKAYNDHYGHQAGDRCLIEIAQLIKAQLDRPHDLVARYGGEEFCVLLPATDIQGAISVAQRVLNKIFEMKTPHEGISANTIVTVSIGVAQIRPDYNTPIESLIEQADTALYEAKRTGKAKICVKEPNCITT